MFARMPRESRSGTEPRQVGLEIKLNLAGESGLPSMKNTEVPGAIADPSWASELGQFNLEINCRRGLWSATRWRGSSTGCGTASGTPTPCGVPKSARPVSCSDG